MVDKDLSRLYPEHGSYFHTPGCQGILRRILLLWCLRHPEYGYRQGKLYCSFDNNQYAIEMYLSSFVFLLLVIYW